MPTKRQPQIYYEFLGQPDPDAISQRVDEVLSRAMSQDNLIAFVVSSDEIGDINTEKQTTCT